MLDRLADQDLIADRWDEDVAATLSPQELLLYRSNLLGSDKRVTNYGGGNTSSKIAMTDPLTGETVDVLWVKGSGGDIGSMKLDGFATLSLDKLKAVAARYAGPRRRTRSSTSIRIAPSPSIRARPRSTRRCTGCCPTPTSITSIRTR